MPELMEELDGLVPQNQQGRPKPFNTGRWTEAPIISGKMKPSRSSHGPTTIACTRCRNALGRAGPAVEATPSDESGCLELTRGVFWSAAARAEHLSDVRQHGVCCSVWTLPPARHTQPTQRAQPQAPQTHPILQSLRHVQRKRPHRAPAMMHVIPHLEHGIGTFLPEGGMRAIPPPSRSLGQMPWRHLPHRHACRRILHDRGRVTGVEDERGQVHKADWVVSNADLHPTYRRLPRFEGPLNAFWIKNDPSGVIFYWG